MGLGGIGVTQLLIVLFIVIMIFGTKRFKQAGGDFGGMIRGIREGFNKEEGEADLAEIAKEMRSTVDEVNAAKNEFTRERY